MPSFIIYRYFLPTCVSILCAKNSPSKMTDPKMKKKSYYSRFQVKKRRRREGKTDYKQRRKLLTQDNTRYGVYKSRLVVRFTNTKVICAVVRPTYSGDNILCYADSTELKKYGINFGLTNSSAAYLTGFLLGQRVLEKFSMKECGFGNNEELGDYFVQEENDDGVKPFECFLDIGLKRATNGAKVFLAMKGASDAGVRVPHSPKRFYGAADGEVDVEKLRNKILGKDLRDFAVSLRDSDPEKFKKQFSRMSALVDIEKIPEIYEAAIGKIKEDPKKTVKPNAEAYYKEIAAKYAKIKKSTKEEKTKKIQEKLKEVVCEN
ncbi:hypothetical protein EDEG_01515 [Edhazardia aedis USNM 41457]|uniref:Large ribosomal subunit protein uL18 C-terminal eukaryotes domain-containing protein n=1 Tax=Edhazardia aedis (strain USNM 41457) TaxID=1003232 RepID=J9DSB3_EDHAE|nr:hypothetical protein EDEG_01515 [Edhazardia aedis USNM 41457]|eukprot:EJW04197.1 hypothetical protein EDEG_01515 [Edhazardia aedis USNM 41457]